MCDGEAIRSWKCFGETNVCEKIQTAVAANRCQSRDSRSPHQGRLESTNTSFQKGANLDVLMTGVVRNKRRSTRFRQNIRGGDSHSTSNLRRGWAFGRELVLEVKNPEPLS